MEYLIESLGEPRYPSPLRLSSMNGDLIANFVDDRERVVETPYYETWLKWKDEGIEPRTFEVAGPRSKLFFDPAQVKAAVVTCGGLCPGLNDVIRGLVMVLYYHYGVKDILGVRYGYRGMSLRFGGTAIPLDPDIVASIHTSGGSFLGSSRGPQSTVEMVDFLQRRDIRLLFVVGGDGTIRGALSIGRECKLRNYPAAVIGIPKTIDNDIACIDRSFGFSTAVAKAKEILDCAHVEARGAFNGVGLVKLMGRFSGFIAARATLASGEVNFVLVPEVPFDLDGENGFLKHLAVRLTTRHHALVVVAEGAGQELMNPSAKTLETDPSGNVKLRDIGVFLKKKIAEYMCENSIPVVIKYFDPSYLVRSARANAEDGVYCFELAQNAVHAAMAGKTMMIVGSRNNQFVHIPMKLAVSRRKHLNPDSQEWLAVVESTGQPNLMVNNR